MSGERKWNSFVLRGFEEFLEKARAYRQDGYHPLLLGDILDGRYRVIHKLGHGGSSTVWLCQDTDHCSPKYVAVKILKAILSETECRELIIARYLSEIAIDNEPGGEHICLPLRDFRIKGPNGTHVCIVYPFLGPDLGSVMDLLEDDQQPDVCAATIRQLVKQVMKGLANIHSHGICHGDVRPSNILLQLRSLDGLSREEVYDVLGEPETADIILRNGSEKVTVPHIPPYLVYPIDFRSVDSSELRPHIYITDFGESFDTSIQPLRLTGIPRPYCAPEMVFDGKAGLSADLWALGCLLFEVRLRDKIIYPSDLMGPNDDDYIISVCTILGKLPDKWWKTWVKRDRFFETADGKVYSPLVEIRGKLPKNIPSNVDPPRSIKGKIRASYYRSTQGNYEEHQKISEREMELMADLLEQLLRYHPEERLPAQEAVNHQWVSEALQILW